MTNAAPLHERDVIRFYENLFRKLVEDLIEAYQRTPLHISSKPYIERALNLALAGLDASRLFRNILECRIRSS